MLTRRLIFGGLLVGAMAGVAWGSADDDEEFFQTFSRGPANLSQKRAYPGARDEQPIEIQASLAQPARSPDGSAAPSTDDGEDLPNTAPASD